MSQEPDLKELRADLRTYSCTRAECDGTAHRSQFLLPTGEPRTVKPGVLWECNTCGSLWNLDGTAWKSPYADKEARDGR